ncbi:hypothetical protein AXG93_461s1060 [Marchantia polymorpha subsp. ruderalis]|uniref:Uncharacterized protein n=1 Tax=Marchantia polymorpha subsp. ruderalis TaxID=1480154 RepID=A0A176VGD4_MARPO|nr:hypothetical protein AXG93_461s1060 [Marchantia polymorpha subsp. ruderalis]
MARGRSRSKIKIGLSLRDSSLRLGFVDRMRGPIERCDDGSDERASDGISSKVCWIRSERADWGAQSIVASFVGVAWTGEDDGVLPAYDAATSTRYGGHTVEKEEELGSNGLVDSNDAVSTTPAGAAVPVEAIEVDFLRPRLPPASAICMDGGFAPLPRIRKPDFWPCQDPKKRCERALTRSIDDSRAELLNSRQLAACESPYEEEVS